MTTLLPTTLATLLSVAVATAADWHAPGPTELFKTIAVGGKDRTYIVHLPTGYDALGTPMPLLVMLHGGRSNGAQMDHYSNVSEFADRHGAIVCYPDGGWNAHLNVEDDDVRFIDALLERLSRDYAVDQAHVMVGGCSAGALMAFRAALELAPRVKTIGAVSGEMTWNLKNGEPPPPRIPAAPVSVIEVQGRDDRLMAGFRSATATGWSCDRTLGWWAEQDGCGAPVETIANGVTRRTWAPGHDGAQVAMVAIEGVGHGYPTADHGGVDSTTELWNFLTRDEPCRLPRCDVFIGKTEVRLEPSPSLPEGAVLACTTDGSEPTAVRTAPAALALTDTTTIRVAAFRDGKRIGTERAALYRRLVPRPADHPAATQPGLAWAYVPGDRASAIEAIGLVPTATGSCAALDPSVAPTDHHYSLVFTGYLRVPADGLYTLSATSDDGCVVDIGGERVVSCDGAHPSHARTGVAALSAGLHALRVAYFEAEGDRVLSLALASGNDARRMLGAADFVRDQ